MFRRVFHEHWHDLVPVIAFILTFAVFVVAFIRALLFRKETILHMASLPLDVALPVESQAATAKPCSDTCRRSPTCRHRHEDAASLH